MNSCKRRLCCMTFFLIIYGREIILYLCIHDVQSAFHTLFSGFKEACGEESRGKEEGGKRFGIPYVCCLIG